MEINMRAHAWRALGLCCCTDIIIKRKTWALSHYAAASKLAEIIFARHFFPAASLLKYSARLEFDRSFFRGQSDVEKRA